MTRSQWLIGFISMTSVGFSAAGCNPVGVGDPCIPEDEYSATFSGFGVSEANVESRSLQCDTRVCIVNHFQGRVSCPYGQRVDASGNVTSGTPPGACHVPSSTQKVTVPVDAQLLHRRAQDRVYCSCRCEGADKTANYCSCPIGYSCLPLIPDLGLGKEQLAGKYCLKNTENGDQISELTCAASAGNCPSEGTSNPNMNP